MTTTSPRGFRWCAYSCQPILRDTQGFGIIWRTLPSWVHKITQRLQPLHMMYCDITRSRNHNSNNIHHLGRRFYSRVTIQKSERQSQQIMGDHLRISCSTAARKWDTMRETTRHQQPNIVQVQYHYRSESSWRKKQPTSQKRTLSIIIGSCWTHAPPSDQSGKDTSFKKSAPMTQENNSGHILTGDIRIAVTPKPQQYNHSKCFTTLIPLQTYSHFPQWRASLGSPTIHN